MQTPISELAELGASYPLYFYIVRFTVVFLIGVFCFAGFPCLCMNLASNHQQEWADNENEEVSHYLTVFAALTPATVGTTHKVHNIQPILHAFALILLIVFVEYMKPALQQLGASYEFFRLSLSKFTLKVVNLPEDFTELGLKEFFEGLPDTKFTVTKVVRVLDLEVLLQLKKELNEWKARKVLLSEYYAKHGRTPKFRILGLFFCKYPDLSVINDKILEYTDLIRTVHKNRVKLFKKSTAFVSFKTQLETLQLEKMTHHRWCHSQDHELVLDGHRLKVYRAEDPGEIIWKNLHLTYSEQVLRRSLTLLFLAFLLFLSYSVLNSLMKTKISLSSQDPNNIGEVVQITTSVAIISLILVVATFLMVQLCEKLTRFERHYSHTERLHGATRSSIVVKTLNLGFILFLVCKDPHFWFVSRGLVDQVAALLTINILADSCQLSAVCLLAFKRLRQILIEKNPNHMLNQAQANKLYEGVKLRLGECFSDLVASFYLTLFYTPIFPLATLITIFSLTLNHFVFKYFLVHLYARPKCIGKELALGIGKWLGYGVYIYAVRHIQASIWFFFMKLGCDNWASIVPLIIAGFYAVFNIYKFFRETTKPTAQKEEFVRILSDDYSEQVSALQGFGQSQSYDNAKNLITA